MSIALHVTVDSAMTQAQLGRLIRATSPLSISRFLGSPMTDFLHRRISTRFASQGDDVSGKWLALRAATGGYRTSQGFGAFRPINIRTGHMLHSLLTRRVSDDTLTVPAPTDALAALKIATAQRGKLGTAKQAATAPRPVLGVNRVDATFATTSLLDWIMTGGVAA